MLIFIVVISIIFNLFIVFRIYKKLQSQIIHPEIKERSEINGLIVEFNRTAKNNIDLLEEKMLEMKNLLNLMDEKNKGLITPSLIENEVKSKPVPEKKKKEKKRKKSIKHDNIIDLTSSSKSSIVEQLYNDGKSSLQISKIIGISKLEVDLLLKFINKKQ
jgi:hypothetical protein